MAKRPKKPTLRTAAKKPRSDYWGPLPGALPGADKLLWELAEVKSRLRPPQAPADNTRATSVANLRARRTWALKWFARTKAKNAARKAKRLAAQEARDRAHEKRRAQAKAAKAQGDNASAREWRAALAKLPNVLTRRVGRVILRRGPLSRPPWVPVAGLAPARGMTDKALKVAVSELSAAGLVMITVDEENAWIVRVRLPPDGRALARSYGMSPEKAARAPGDLGEWTTAPTGPRLDDEDAKLRDLWNLAQEKALTRHPSGYARAQRDAWAQEWFTKAKKARAEEQRREAERTADARAGAPEDTRAAARAWLGAVRKLGDPKALAAAEALVREGGWDSATTSGWPAGDAFDDANGGIVALVRAGLLESADDEVVRIVPGPYGKAGTAAPGGATHTGTPRQWEAARKQVACAITVTIAGPPRCGKSALATALVRCLREEVGVHVAVADRANPALDRDAAVERLRRAARDGHLDNVLVMVTETETAAAP